MYVGNRPGLSHHARWAWKSHLSRRARGARWALASSWTGGSRRALVSLGARSSILAGRPAFTLPCKPLSYPEILTTHHHLLPRLAIFSWRSILARGPVLARKTLRTLRTVFPWRTWGTLWSSCTRRSCWTWFLGLQELQCRASLRRSPSPFSSNPRCPGRGALHVQQNSCS